MKTILPQGMCAMTCEQLSNFIIDKMKMNCSLFTTDYRSGSSWHLCNVIEQIVAYGFEWGESDGI